MYKHIILDRDGTICEENSCYFISCIQDWKWISNFPDLIRNYNKRISIVTNQSCIGRGFLKEKDLNKLHSEVFKDLIDINSIYYCPHSPNDNCVCRKPYPTLIFKAIEDSNISKDETVLIGDDIKDYYAAKAAGIDFLLVLTGKGQSTFQLLLQQHIDILAFNDIRDVFEYIHINEEYEQDFKEHLTLLNKIRYNKKNIEKAGKLLINTINNKNKILVCGNGGSAADSQHFVAELIGRFEKERKSIPAISLTVDSSILTAIGNDYSFNKCFSRQIEALGKENDILLVITTSGNSQNIIEAIKQAKKQKMDIIGLTGNNGGILSSINKNGINIIIPSSKTARIQEIHIFILHYFAKIIEKGCC